MLRSAWQRSLGVGLLGLWLGTTALPATIIRLKDGRTWEDVTIVERGPHWVKIEGPYGVIRVPLQEVQSIDGAPPTPAGPLANPTPVPLVDVVPYAHRWTMDFFILGLAVLAAVWIRLLLWVQRDADELYDGRPGPVKLRNTVVLLLPGLGFVMYLVARRNVLRGRHALVAEAAAGSNATVGAVPQKKWRFLFQRPAAPPTPARTREEALMLAFLDADGNPIPIRKTLPGMSGIGTARDLLAEAIIERASDVHLEPREHGWRVRFRIDGVLQERKHLAKTDTLRMVSSLKTLAGIDVAEKRKAQDGRFGVHTSRGDVDLRVATTNSIHGEKLVLRILDRKTGLLTLGELGMAKPMLAVFDRMIHSHTGMILVTGPTGSGKTTTLYAALNQLDAKKLNIMTIEDPVEYELDGATQIPVNPRAGVTYAAGLRSILRQDPDVIFVGEMRDEEAAKIAVRSALTGHLVFSSLHTNNAIGTIARLMEVGIEKYQIASSLLMVVAQRLVRVLCQVCREPYEPAAGLWQELGAPPPPPGATIYRAHGCEQCGETGYLGRTAVFELLVMDDELWQAYHEGFNEQKLWALARRKGSRSLSEDGADKILAGITTFEEVLRAE